MTSARRFVGIISVSVLGALAMNIGMPATAADPADTHPGLNLIPWPHVVKLGDGRLRLTAKSRISVQDNELQSLADVLSGEMDLLTGLKLPVVTGAGQPGDIVLGIDQSLLAGEPILAVRSRQTMRTKDGAHRLTITDRAVIEGFDYRAVAEGSATLLQALGQVDNQVSLPKLVIDDWPHADYCAMMVDVGRQDHPIDWLRKMVQACRFYKVRYLHLHLTDDQGWTFPSQKYPQLGSKNYGAHGGVAPKVYKLDKLKALVAYADARGVTLVPELEMPGHSGAALRSLPEVFDAIDPKSKQPVGMGCMNIANEDLYPALDAIIGEMCAVFKSSPYFHMGGDEVSMGRVALHTGYKAFMEKHGLKDDHDLGRHFVVRVNEIVKKHGKKLIKWEGLANEASKDILVMCWDNNNNTASRLIAQGFTTITCPWNLGVPWEEWNMYICNGSLLKKGDLVLGATLVAWEQPPQTHLAGVRNVASRQERTWNPDNKVTASGFAARFQALDAAVGKLVGMPVKPRMDCTFQTPARTRDLLEPAFAFDGSDATFHQSARPLKAGEHFTMTLQEPKLVHAVEVRTGVNQRGLLNGGGVQVSSDGTNFETVATLAKGSANVILPKNRVRAVRLLATADQTEPLVLREIALRLLVEVAGMVKDPTSAIGEGNLAMLNGDTRFGYPLNDCAVPIINNGFTLTLDNGGNPASYSGPISGTGSVEIHMGLRDGKSRDSALTLSGKAANTLKGAWSVKAGRLVLAKDAGVPAIGGTIVVGGQGDNDGIVWNSDNQMALSSVVSLLNVPNGGAYLDLNGHSDAVASLTLTKHNRVLTDGPNASGILRVGKLVVDGDNQPQGVYTSAAGWVQGGGCVVVGEVASVAIAGDIDNPHKAIGLGNIAVLKAAATIRLPADECAIPINTASFPLTLVSDAAPTRYSGFIMGNGQVRIDARHPIELAGKSAHAYRGTTVLLRGVLTLKNPDGMPAIPGDLSLGGSAAENKGDRVVLGADGQIGRSAVVTLAGDQPSIFDLGEHQLEVARVVMSRAATIHTGERGTLKVKQLHVAGKRLADGIYKAPQDWLRGTGSVIVDARVDVSGTYGDPNTRIGVGNIANLTGKTRFAYPVGDCAIDVITNGHPLTLDSGDGNPFCYRGAISGTGDVILLMGPSHTDYKDAPLRIAGDRPNTTSGRFFVRKGRVQLEKPAGVDAISGDVIVGGQGFNDCLFWVNSNQVKDTANIALIGAGNNGFAYLHLNGCSETVASLTMSSRNAIKTNSATAVGGILMVKSLTIDEKGLPAGTYVSSTHPWIEGNGKVVVQP